MIQWFFAVCAFTADFFIDGVRDDAQYYRPLYNLEQVEVLKGPNALLFGRGGTGGVLNRSQKRAFWVKTSPTLALLPIRLAQSLCR